MGCDIHIFLEKKKDKNSEWFLDEGHTWSDEYDEPYLTEVDGFGRWYTLFNELAGIRGPGGMFDPRGWPNDICDELKKVQESDQIEHTPTWLTHKEFKKALIKAYKEESRLYDEGDDERRDYDPEANGPVFYDYKSIPWDDHPGFDDLVNYCQRWIDEVKAEGMLLGVKYRPEIRLVFYFDS